MSVTSPTTSTRYLDPRRVGGDVPVGHDLPRSWTNPVVTRGQRAFPHIHGRPRTHRPTDPGPAKHRELPTVTRRTRRCAFLSSARCRWSTHYPDQDETKTDHDPADQLWLDTSIGSSRGVGRFHQVNCGRRVGARRRAGGITDAGPNTARPGGQSLSRGVQRCVERCVERCSVGRGMA